MTLTFTDPFGLCSTAPPDSLEIEVKVKCSNGEEQYAKIWAHRVSAAGVAALNAAAGGLSGGSGQVNGDVIAAHYQMATAGGAVYTHGTVAAGGAVITGAKTTRSYMSFRSDIWENIQIGALNAPVAGTTACNVVGHEGVHLLQSTASTPLSDQPHLYEDEAKSYMWGC